MPSRASKEIRSLLLPAGLVLAATVISALLASHPSAQVYQVAVSIGMSAFILGTPLLAAWSLGAEFQQRTFVLLLSQPVSRSRLWMEKWLTLLLVGGLVVAVQSSLLPVDEDVPARALAIWSVVAVAATPFWTLVARSTIGGMAFSGGVVVLLEGAAAAVVYWVVPGGRVELLRQTPVLNALRVLYPIAAFAAGWWWFSRAEPARFEPAAGASSHLARRLAVPFLGYRRTGALRNLVVTEMHLHRTTWLLAAGWAVCWLGAIALLAASRATTGTIETTFSLLLGVYVPLGVVLAGTLSVSEDMTLGVHAWRLTFPLSVRAQWLVKLAGALLVAAVVVVALPAGMFQVLTLVFWPERGLVPVQPQAIALALGLVVVCFWAATVFGHTVRAAVAAGSVLVAVVIAVSLVTRLSSPVRILETAMTWVMVRWHLPPDFFSAFADRGFFIAVPLAMSAVGLPLSLHAFRRVQIGRTATAAHVATMFAVMLVTAVATLVFTEAAWRQVLSVPVNELRLAIADATPRSPAGMVELTGEDLRRTGRLSPETEGWLAGSRISVETRADATRSVRVRFPGARAYVFSMRPTAR